MCVDSTDAVISTRRMRLRRFDFGDAEALVELDSDPRVRRYIIDDPIDTLTQALLLVDHLQSLYADGRGLGIWHAADATGSFLGHFSLMPVDEDDVAIGVRLHPRAWGHHYAIEGGRALCRYAFKEIALPRVIGYCDPDNRVVDLLLRRLRFVHEGAVRQDGRHVSRYVLNRPT